MENSTFDDNGMTTVVPPRLPRWLSLGVGIAAILVILIWSAETPPGILGKADAIGYAICHRIASHSFLINGMPMPLCARCTGIYLGVIVSFFITFASGRTRASRLPPLSVNIVLGLFVVAMGIDGVNSYISFFPGAHQLYASSNPLRLITGMFCGITMFNLVFPVFNGVVWRAPANERVINNLRELLGIGAVAVGVILLVLTQQPAYLWVAGILSTIGVVMMLTMIGMVIFMSLFRMDRSATSWRTLAVPMLAGLTLAFIQLGGIDFLRYALTGTWNGFTIGG